VTSSEAAIVMIAVQIRMVFAEFLKYYDVTLSKQKKKKKKKKKKKNKKKKKKKKVGHVPCCTLR
jgi:arginine exporter protein ArgO